jgi:hypothetical protein
MLPMTFSISTRRNFGFPSNNKYTYSNLAVKPLVTQTTIQYSRTIRSNMIGHLNTPGCTDCPNYTPMKIYQ